MTRLLPLLAALLLLTSASAQTLPSSAPATAPAAAFALTPSDKLASTHHQITIAGQPLAYTATAGYLPLKDEAGKPRAHIFFVAYTADSPAPAFAPASRPSIETRNSKLETPRPVTFLFNGGPGAASAWLHLGTAGPYRLPLVQDNGQEAPSPAPPYKLLENQFTWLSDTDLVFIDPVGTGYSRAATPEQAKEFYNTKEDIASLGEFIRLYTTKYERWDSPKFLAGESFGATRAAMLAEHLQDRVGLALNGVLLISSALSFQLLSPSESNEIPYALFLPSYTAVAFYHRKLPADMQKDLDKTLAEAREFALGPYVAALAQGDRLPADQRAALAAKIARYTGLPVDFVTQANLRVDPRRFEKQLLAGSGQMVGRFDGRITAPAADPLSRDPDFDPSLSRVLPVYTAAFNSYVRANLRYENDLPYEVLKGLPFSFATEHRGGYLYVGDNLRSALQKNPAFKVLVASGRCDLATPFASTDYVLDHLALPAALRANITTRYYPGGHMMYHEKSGLEQLHADVAAFIRAAVKPIVASNR